MTSASLKPQRCAIYTRVSTDSRLDQEFNSLQAQREAAQSYVKSQAHEGWRLIRERYDDGGFSGGSLDRPALQRLLADIREQRIDIVVVYKVDRLTRSLTDFAKLVELFDAHGVAFVSVTQSFNTTSSMGRLTLNVLLSFAQFEREVTGERIRDKIAASKKKGLWVGGVVPLGYEVQGKKLIVNQQEAETVRLIFSRYLDLGSLPALQKDLRERGIVTRRRTLSSGRVVGGNFLTNGPLAYLLRNRVYLGEINHRNQSYPGEQEPIVDQGVFESVQAKLSGNRQGLRQRRQSSNALLLGKLFDDRGNPMTPSYAIKKGVRYRYYVSSVLAQGRKEEAGSVARVAADAVERIVLDAVRDRGPDPESSRRNDCRSDRQSHSRRTVDRASAYWRRRSAARKDCNPLVSGAVSPQARGDRACERWLTWLKADPGRGPDEAPGGRRQSAPVARGPHLGPRGEHRNDCDSRRSQRAIGANGSLSRLPGPGHRPGCRRCNVAARFRRLAIDGHAGELGRAGKAPGIGHAALLRAANPIKRLISIALASGRMRARPCVWRLRIP